VACEFQCLAAIQEATGGQQLCERYTAGAKLKKFRNVNSSGAVKSRLLRKNQPQINAPCGPPGKKHSKTYKMELQGAGVVLIWLSASEKQRLTRREFERQQQL
jgi:hypothetical protein